MVGLLPLRVYILMYMNRGKEWRTAEIAKTFGEYRQNITRALRKLEEYGYVERLSPHRWKIKK